MCCCCCRWNGRLIPLLGTVFPKPSIPWEVTTLNRREFLKRIGAGTVAMGLVGASAMGEAGEKRKPNVVFIITDDQPVASFGFLARGGPKALTPNIDKLAERGVYFSRCYVSSSVCTPSRYTCLTGSYASRSQSVNFKRAVSKEGQTDVQWNTNIRPDDLALPKLLQRHGYATGAVGKWHNGGPQEWGRLGKTLDLAADPADPKVARALRTAQDALHAWVRSCGFDYAESINLGNYGAHPCRKLRHHNPEWITKGALDFIERNKDRPFYLYMAPTLLHGPSPLKSLKSDPRMAHCGLLADPPKVQPSRQDVLRRVREAKLPERLAGATWLDDSIGAVLGKLDELGLADNTLVIYFNDNGMEGAKGSCYEGGVRTPCVIRWPGKTRAGKRDALIQNTDFAPTILAACGIHPPKEMALDGLDLTPLLTGREDTLRESVYCEIAHTRAVVTGRWKYIAFRIPPSKQLTKAQRIAVCARYKAMKARREDKDFRVDPDAPLSHMGFPGGQATERHAALKKHARTYYDADQLYDLQNDPGEQKNLADDPAHQARLAEMKALLARHVARAPGTFAEFKT